MVERHVALQQFKVKRDVEPVATGIRNGLVLGLSCHNSVTITNAQLEHVEISVYPPPHRCLGIPCSVARSLLARGRCNSGRRPSHRWTSLPLILIVVFFTAAKFLHHNPARAGRVQTDSESQTSRSRHNNIMRSEVGKAHEKLLVLVY